MNSIELNVFIEKTPIMYAANRKNTRFKLCIQCSYFCIASKTNTLKTEITWNYILYLVITYNGKESEKEYIYNQFSRVESLSCVCLRPQGLQHTRPPCPSPNPGVYPNSCPLSQWCRPTISPSVIPFSSHLQSFPASGSFPKSQFFASGDQSIGVSASVSVLPMNIQD